MRLILSQPYATLPDRQEVTGAPRPGVLFRDSTRPGLVFSFVAAGSDWNKGRWQAFDYTDAI